MLAPYLAWTETWPSRENMSRIFKLVGTTVSYIDNAYKLSEKREASTSPYDRHRQNINITEIIRVKNPLR